MVIRLPLLLSLSADPAAFWRGCPECPKCALDAPIVGRRDGEELLA